MGYDPCPVPGQYDETLEPNFTIPHKLIEWNISNDHYEEVFESYKNTTKHFMKDNKLGPW